MLARAFGVSGATVRRYLDLLTSALVLRQLPPWFENLWFAERARRPSITIDPLRMRLIHHRLHTEVMHQEATK